MTGNIIGKSDMIKKLVKLLSLLLHVLKALYLYFRYFYTFDPTCNAFTDKQKKLMQQWFTQILHIINIEVNIAPQPDKITSPIIFVANHISWLDIPLLGQLFSVRFIAKSEVANWPIISKLATKSGAIFIRRGKASDLKNIAQRSGSILALNENLAFFPEGKTGEGDKMLPIYSGLFQVSLDNNTPVLPMVLSYSDGHYPAQKLPFVGDQSFLSNVWKIVGIDKIKVYIDFGEEIKPEGKSRKQISQEVSRQMEKLLEIQLSNNGGF